MPWWRLLCAAVPALGSFDAKCVATTQRLQAAIDAAAINGGVARFPCGFHATLPLNLSSGVRINADACVSEKAATESAPKSLRLGACGGTNQQHIIDIRPGHSQSIEGVIFDCTNITND